jgi:hypothetical protein
MSKRGELTEKCQKIALERIGRKISTIELRLIPYVQYVMTNAQKIEPIHINVGEREILQRWREEGFIQGGASGLRITKAFWDFMCEVLFETYVDID